MSPVLGLVVTGSWSQFRHWCHMNKVSPHDTSYRNISRSLQLRGYSKRPLYVFGTWFENDALYASVEEYCVRHGIVFQDLPRHLPTYASPPRRAPAPSPQEGAATAGGARRADAPAGGATEGRSGAGG